MLKPWLSYFTSKNNFDYLFSAIILGILCLVGLDSIGSQETVHNLIGISAADLVVPGLILVAVWRWQQPLINLIPAARFLLMTLILVLTLAVTGLTCYGVGRHPNAVFSLTHLNLNQLTVGLVFASLSLLLLQTKSWWQKCWTQVVFWLPFIALALFYLASLWPMNFFKELVKEDHLVENLQFWVLALGSLGLLPALLSHWRKKHWLRTAITLAAIIGFAAVAGDEIAWGQRLLGLEVSEAVKEVNRQEELTFHNLYAVEWLVIYAYTALSLFGTLGGVLIRSIKSLQKYEILAPLQHLIGYFVLPLIYFVQQLRVEWGIWHSWSEVAELSLYAGLVLWMVIMERKSLASSL